MYFSNRLWQSRLYSNAKVLAKRNIVSGRLNGKSNDANRKKEIAEL
jgi:hypothetical protein